MNEPRSFLVFFAVAGALLLTAALVSYIGDPEGIFGRNVDEPEIAARLLAGQNVVNFNNYDDRLIQQHLLRADPLERGAIVLGSSRSMQIRNYSSLGPVVGDRLFFNYAVSGGSLEDDIALLDLYLERGAAPRAVVLGADPWLLNAESGLARWRSIEGEYHDGLARLGAPAPAPDPPFSRSARKLDRYSALLSRPILVKAISKLGTGAYSATDRESADGYLKLANGSVVYPNASRERAPREIAAAAREYAAAYPADGLGGFAELDGGAQARFEAMVRYLRERDAAIVLYLPPYHPTVYATLATDPRYARVAEAESYFRGVAAREGLTVVGSYDPGRLNLASVAFYDGWHLRGEATERVFAAAMADGRGA